MKVFLIAAAFYVAATVPHSPLMIGMSGTWELNARKTLGPSPVQETPACRSSRCQRPYPYRICCGFRVLSQHVPIETGTSFVRR